MMKKIMQAAAALASGRRGVAAMEFGMIAAATIVAIAGLVHTISGKLSTIFSTVSTSL